MDLVERVGSGIPRIAEEMKAAGLPAPEYKTEGFFVTTLYKARPSDTSKTTDLGETTEKKTGKKTRKKTREIPRGKGLGKI